MLLFCILAIILLVIVGFTIGVLGAFGGVFVIIFADVIVCGAIIVLLMKSIRNKKKNHQ